MSFHRKLNKFAAGPKHAVVYKVARDRPRIFFWLPPHTYTPFDGTRSKSTEYATKNIGFFFVLI